MAIVVQWAVSVLILYRLDWRHLPLIGTDDPQASSEVRLALAGLGGILLVFWLNFLWQILRQPAAMDAELRQEMTRQAQAANELDAQRRAEIDQLRAAIERVRDAEALLQRLSDLYEKGRAIYTREADRETWEERLRAWNAEVEKIIDDNFSVSVQHRFRRGGNGMMMATRWNPPDGDERLKYRYTGLLMALDELIKLGSPLRTSELRLPR